MNTKRVGIDLAKTGLSSSTALIIKKKMVLRKTASQRSATTGITLKSYRSLFDWP